MSAGDWIAGMVLVGLTASTITGLAVAWRLSRWLRELRNHADDGKDLLILCRQLIMTARPGAFRNGVETHGRDEGEYYATRTMIDVDRWLDAHHEMRGGDDEGRTR